VNVCKDPKKADECHTGRISSADPIASFEGYSSSLEGGGVAGFKLVSKSGKEISLGNLETASSIKSLGIKPIAASEAIVGMKFDF
jgi:hypothetical protein